MLVLMMLGAAAMAAPVTNMPVLRVQPNGDTLRCWVSGDEFFHRLHDADGYTIVQNVKTGMYVYAALENGVLVPTEYVPGRVNPAQVGLKPNLMPSAEELKRLHHLWDIPEPYRAEAPKTSGYNHGTLNNLVIFIRFSGEDSCTSDSFTTIDAMFNDSTAGATSMYSYFKVTSYNNLAVRTTYRPAPMGDRVLSYQDTLSRDYYMPYSSVNPNGYVDYAQRTDREFSLLARAVEWVNANCPVDSNVNLDMDDDGFVDNICFVVSGSNGGWNDLLWPHKWGLYDRYVYINGKRVYTFNLQLAGSGDHYFGVSTFCHEMTHTLGCPDLYHYYNYTHITPVGSWDLMCSNQTPPQQTNSLFKFKYLNWFDSIPQITDSGRYTIRSLATGPNRAYKIASSHPQQWYILEYRNSFDTFDSSIPNRGLLIWRYNDWRYASNAQFNNVDTMHELWLFRPNSSDDITLGNVVQAGFGRYDRTWFSAWSVDTLGVSNPYPYLCDGTPDSSFSLTDILVSDDDQSVSFTFAPHHRTCGAVTSFPEKMDFEEGTTGCWRADALSLYNYEMMGVIEEEVVEDELSRPRSGNYQFRFSSYLDGVEYDQYLISPRLEPSNPLHMVFYYRTYPRGWSGPDVGVRYLSVMYSTTGDAVEDFTEELYRVLPDVPWGWDKISVLVPETAKYVAINYRSYDLCYVYIDDIELRDTLQRDTTYVYVHDTLYYAAADTVVVTVRDTQFVSPHYYEVLVFADEPERGTVIGSGVFPEGTVVEIAAIANEGYVFERWSDGRLDNPRRVRVNDDVLMSAFFVADSGTGGGTMTQFFHDTLIVRDTIWLLNPNENPFVRYEHTPFEYDSTVYCTLTALSADAERGLVAGGGRFPRGTMVEVGALALPGYDFWRWEDNSTENPRTVAVVGDMTVRAFFKAEGPEEVTEAEGNRAKIFARGSRLVVELEKAEPVAVYTILGQEIYQAPTPQRRTQLNGLRRGIYLVKVGERAARKVVVLGE